MCVWGGGGWSVEPQTLTLTLLLLLFWLLLFQSMTEVHAVLNNKR